MLHRLWAPLDVPRRRRRGGWRQQLQTIETELEAEPARASRLASGLLLEWADGSMSAAKLQQQHCSHAQEDGPTHTILAGYYDQHPGTHRLPPLRLAKVTSDGRTNLRGPAIKTANTRAAVPAFRSLCHRWFDRGTLSDNSVRLVIDALHEVYDVLDNELTFVSDGGISRLHAASIQLGTEYQKLREFARVADRRGWHIIPKAHKILHYPYLARVINPKADQNYGEEALIGTLTNTWKRSISGRDTKKVQVNVLTKRIVALLLRLALPIGS